MSDVPDAPEPADSHEAELLDQFVEQLQAGRQPDSAALARAHPEWASALRCIEALEQIAPDADEPPESESEQPPSGSWPRDFGPYELLGEIGRGGMGVVYKARQKDLDRVVALKMILATHLASSEHVRRFQAEAKAAARLRHSHVVPIHEVGQIHGQHYFTMEYIEGESLAARAARGPIDPTAAATLLASVARAVEHLHRQGIVHRDLKPSNILLDEQGEPYVTDFGLAKVFVPGSDATATGVIAGTPSFMAPEQAAGHNAEVGPAADVYSLGAVLYQLLTGQPPFHEESPLDTLLEVLSRDAPPPRELNPKVPRGLDLITMKCLAKSPAERYASAAELADDLNRFLSNEPLRVRPPTFAQQVLGWTRRQPALASRLGALAAFYAIELVNFAYGKVSPNFHKKISVLMLAWAAGSIICQQFLSNRRWSIPARFVWGMLDSLLLLAALLVADGAASPLVVGYPLLIVASGLWFRVRFVWFITGMSLLSYGVLMVDLYRWRPELQAGFHGGWDRHAIFALSLVVLGSVVASLAYRVRTLSGFCGRPLP